ncbi:hypothetical protein Syun_030625 [Stephania yunnanensis]|uniref:Uncharacterized protein n=1 Tax=Stephania yunnanensis TaxID=152371 RepID=A0AAP0DY21_9MAGN
MLEHASNSLLYVTRIWADCVNELIIIAIRLASECFAWRMRKNERSGGDDGVETMVMLRKEFDGNLERIGTSPIPNFYSDYLMMCIKKHSTHPLHSLFTFLGRSAHDSVELSNKISQDSDEFLLLVCLVRMADLLVPTIHSASMVCALDQAFEIIVFIHEKTKSLTASNYMKINVARDIWMSRGVKDNWFQTDIFRLVKNRRCTNHFWDQVRGVIEVHNIIDIIGEPRILDIISSINECTEELYDRMEQLFVELLHYFIDQLPDAVFNGLSDGVPAAQFEKNVQISMKFVARLSLLDSMESSRFFSNNIKSFMTADAAEKGNESRSKDSLV